MKWSDVGKDLEKAAGVALPALAGALGGPEAAPVGAMIAHALGVDSTPEAVSRQVASNPAALVKVKSIEASIAKAKIQADRDTQVAQAEIVKQEVIHGGATWHDGAAWMVIAAIAFEGIVRPLLNAYTGTHIPHADTTDMMSLLGAMLGVGTMQHASKRGLSIGGAVKSIIRGGK